MARKRSKKKKKRSDKSGLSIRKYLSFRNLFIAAVLIGIAGGSVYGVYYFFLNSTMFSVKEIVINNDRGYMLDEGEQRLNRIYQGQNIFSVDLAKIQGIIKNKYPQLRKVEVTRVLPDRINIDVISREPVAVIDSSGGIVIDKEGVVLTVGEGSKDIIKIKGMNFFLNVPSRGERIQNKSLDSALLLVTGLSKKMNYDKGDIDHIDISNKNNIVLGISGVTVNLGADNFSEKIDDLKEIVGDPRIKMSEIRYIDLRFDDPVIAPK